MKRLAYFKLLEWKQNKSRKPLLLQGARQTGKTYLLREFGEKEYADFAYFNFEETPELKSLFLKDLNPHKLVESLSVYRSKTIAPDNTLIFFDEIQECPRALTGLKYFCEQAPEFHVVAAGSLLGVSVGKTSSFPVGKVSFMTLYPLNFIEFLMVSQEETLLQLLLQKKDLAPLEAIIHEKLMGLFRKYLYLGGMPEVVKTYLETNELPEAREIQREILKAYEKDFSKYTTPVQAVRISEIWQSIPSHLSRENKKFKYSTIRKGGRASQFESAIEWLRGAGLLYIAMNVTTAKIPLSGYRDPSRFKAYLFDCGLLGALIDVPAKTLLLNDSAFSEYNGAFTENFVASELAQKHEGILHYWLSEGVAEVDFLIMDGEKILPLEVKSGINRNTKSLRIYQEKFHPRKIYRISARNFEGREDLVNLPLYAASLLPL